MHLLYCWDKVMGRRCWKEPGHLDLHRDRKGNKLYEDPIDGTNEDDWRMRYEKGLPPIQTTLPPPPPSRNRCCCK